MDEELDSSPSLSSISWLSSFLWVREVLPDSVAVPGFGLVSLGSTANVRVAMVDPGDTMYASPIVVVVVEVLPCMLASMVDSMCHILRLASCSSDHKGIAMDIDPIAHKSSSLFGSWLGVQGLVSDALPR